MIRESDFVQLSDDINDFNSKNIDNFKLMKELDGFLIGGASKSSKKFIDIIKNYYR